VIHQPCSVPIQVSMKESTIYLPQTLSTLFHLASLYCLFRVKEFSDSTTLRCIPSGSYSRSLACHPVHDFVFSSRNESTHFALDIHAHFIFCPISRLDISIFLDEYFISSSQLILWFEYLCWRSFFFLLKCYHLSNFSC